MKPSVVTIEPNGHFCDDCAVRGAAVCSSLDTAELREFEHLGRRVHFGSGDTVFSEEDITTSFYNIHHIFQRVLGDDMGFVAWRDIGLNPYGNTVIVNSAFLAKNKALIGKFVKVTQKAFAACVKDPKPCVQALVDANGALKFDNERTNWGLVEVLMSDKVSREVALGWLDDKRMASDYDLVKTYVGVAQPFDVKTIYTNEFLDKSIKMTK